MTTPHDTAEGWQPLSEEPPQDTLIDWMTSTGHIVYGGKKSGRLWFTPDGLYIYYEPTFWRLSKKEQSK